MRDVRIRLSAIRGRLLEANLAMLTRQERADVIGTFDRMIERADNFLDPVQDVAEPVAEPVVAHTGGKGRPRRADFDVFRAVELFNAGNTWTDVAEALQTSRRMISRRLAELPERERPRVRRMDDIVDDDLDELISGIKDSHRYAGAQLVHGKLCTQNVRVPLARMKQRLRAIDPVGNQQR